MSWGLLYNVEEKRGYGMQIYLVNIIILAIVSVKILRLLM